ncbi:MAG: chromosome segregation protein SMC [Planctomycetia bacterium]|nr:chromosome segregation protein SMC [Planctomycetia bacterium]
MLKALELVGFKSFADKTRLEFPRGITVVVGPNGSGKSNIVDAIKWVLGEQSVKSLRCKEMADVIFNGSATRRALNAAETTLTIDNSPRVLAIDAAEVHITRRVYRSGEGEYLINRQPCRLRDIRDLFAGTGVATEAYSVIEQGKVDVLLQSSPRDRRIIFEEAAGISRFKTKKLEALRRLERVEQNLLRLSDIVDEVDSRLRGVRLQANKARRYKEYSDRLQALRTQIALVDWRTLTAKLELLEGELKTARDENTLHLAEVETLERQTLALETRISEADSAMRSSEGRIAQNRERIAGRESAIEHQRHRCRDLEEEVARYRRQLTSMSVRAGDLQQQLQLTTDALVSAEQQHREVARRLAEEERGLTKLTAQVDELRGENEQRRAAHLEHLRAAAMLGNRISGLEAKVSSTQAIRQRGGKRLAELTTARGLLAGEVDQLRQTLAQLEELTQARQTELEQVQSQLAECRRQAAHAHEQLNSSRERFSGATQRAAVLDELEKRLEGLSAGVKQVLIQSQGTTAGPFGQIRGLVADLLHVNYETAPLVEVALGEMAQCLVVAGGRELVARLQASAFLAGRVGFIRLDVLPPKTQLDQLDLHAHGGVLGRADEFVETAPEFAVLAKRLLGKTWIVESLTHALALSESAGRGLSFVTRAGELVAADGTLYVGPRHTSTGLISRRSELRVLRQQLAEMSGQIEQQQGLCAQLDKRIAAFDQRAQTLSAESQRSSQDLGQQRLRAGAAEERFAQVEKQHAAVDAELNTAENEHQHAITALSDSRSQLEKIESTVAELEYRIGEGVERASQLEQTRQRFNRETNATKIDVVKSEQRLSHLLAQKSQFERDQQERGKALADGRSQLEVCLDRLRQAERDILQAESELAELYLRKESFAADAVRDIQQRDVWREQKAQLAQDVGRFRGRIRKLEARLHTKELAAGEVRHERTTLADRLREYYGIELAELEHEPSAEELQERSEVEREIADLRGKLNSIGGVNLDALTELEELESRFNTLSTQHKDLSAAKASLEQIIGKINADSRRLFAETLELVRGHFQSLFRKLFGGGQADIVLDEGVDILDSGIEIVARPPGKEPRSISLLSGGEKTLTCVAMLLAIFRSRPSPFCVLDEVDAALDEANIERFISVLQEFLAWTQFIVVTHSKKTMTCASTLYGITMQESGVSKRVSVRFEDVSDTGEILNVRESQSDEAAGTNDETQAA